MPPELAITNVVHVIQVAVAPVFLLTGVGAVLSVLVARLGRIVDRIRVLNARLAATAAADPELLNLSSRARLIHWAISLCTLCALLVCTVIATLFIGALANVSASGLIAVLFIAAMLTLIAGLMCFLGEIYLAADRLYRHSH